MIRVVFFLLVVGVLALGTAWLADRPGDVVVTWQGMHMETTVMRMVAMILVAMAVLAFIWTVIRAIFSSPFIFRRHLYRRRGERAYEAISRGLIAVGSGDLVAARKHAAEAQRIAPAEPLALFLTAQSAQLAGDREAADAAFRAMASRAETKALGLHGLFVEARRRNDLVSAHAFAEEAARTNPSLGWAGKAVLEFRCATGDWAGALALLEGNKRALDKESYRRQRAVMLTARALAAEEADRDSAKAFALEAAKLAPTFVPAAALAGRMLAEAGELRKATRVLEKAWRANPHPDLAQVFSDLRFGDAARDRLKRIEGLVKKIPGHIEGALALARAAIDAQEFGKARAALASSSCRADQAGRAADGRIGARRAQRRRTRPRMDRTRAARRARSGMDRRRSRIRSLAAGLAERPPRRLRMARAVDGYRNHRAGDRAGSPRFRGCIGCRGERTQGRRRADTGAEAGDFSTRTGGVCGFYALSPSRPVGAAEGGSGDTARPCARRSGP